MSLVRCSVVPCDLGWLLVAATEQGVCRIELGDDPAALREGVLGRFPDAAFDSSDPTFAGWVERIAALVGDPGRVDALPLDVAGTPFQRRVWRELSAIPAGTTRSYSEVARRLGRPSSARAVARACALNPVALAVPCHRVVGNAGDLRGYRWGVERKRELLKRERLRTAADELARQSGVTMSQFLASALAETVSALAGPDGLAARAARGDRKLFEAALRKVADVEPDEQDRI